MALSMGQKAGWGLADMGIVVFVVVKQLLVLAFLARVYGWFQHLTGRRLLGEDSLAPSAFRVKLTGNLKKREKQRKLD